MLEMRRQNSNSARFDVSGILKTWNFPAQVSRITITLTVVFPTTGFSCQSAFGPIYRVTVNFVLMARVRGEGRGGMEFGAGFTATVFSVPDPSLLQNPKAIKSRIKERTMNPMLIVAIPLGLVILGMILNSIGLSFDQPPSSSEQDPAKRAAAEGETYRRFFDLQRKRAVTRQKRVGQYAWLLMAAIIGSFIWLYMSTVTKTTATTQIAALQTLQTEEGKETVLSLTLKDGSNVKYLIKSPTADALEAAKKEGISKQKVSSWDMAQSGTALTIGESPLPVGVALKVSSDPTARKD